MGKRITKVKFCGITNIEDAMYASYLGVDAIGFIFTKSKRTIEPDEAKNIISKLPPFITTVGVFMNDPFEKIKNTANHTGVNIIQLHGDESPEFCKEIEMATGKKIIKRIRISQETKKSELLFAIKKYNDFHILFDPGAGDGKIFDWDLLRNFDFPYIVAGGLSPENVGELINKIKPYAVDVSSGIEKQVGKKDFKKMEKFIKEAKG